MKGYEARLCYLLFAFRALRGLLLTIRPTNRSTDRVLSSFGRMHQRSLQMAYLELGLLRGEIRLLLRELRQCGDERLERLQVWHVLVRLGLGACQFGLHGDYLFALRRVAGRHLGVLSLGGRLPRQGFHVFRQEMGNSQFGFCTKKVQKHAHRMKTTKINEILIIHKLHQENQ